MSTYTQHSRAYIFSSPLGEDLILQRFHGKEAISQLFCFTLDLVSERDDIDAGRMLGEKAALRIEDGDTERHWSGRVSAFARTGQTTRFTTYRCEIVPELWFLLHHEDTRHFQEKSVPGIIDQIFEEFGYSDYRTKLSNEHMPHVYCTQFQENTAEFLARIMECDGLHYYTQYNDTGSELIITDNPDSYDWLAQPAIRYHYDDALQEEDCISSLERRHGMRTGRIVLRDFDFERPHTNLEVSIDTLVRKGDNSPYERFVYAPGYTERPAGERLARLMMEAEEARHEVLHGASNVRALTAGYLFELQDHPIDALNTEYLILSVEHEGSNNIEQNGGGATYQNRFSVLPHSVPYRTPLDTHKKRVFGPQTAFVVGPKGEEIHTDQHGRVKIQFHWDRRGKYDERSSCWARVSQAWAGNGWGTFFLPRVGQEVVVQFLEGDPDRPIVTGCVYNGINVPPYELPEHQTRSTIKTWSTPGGGGANELRFEDRKDKEEILLHAQRDLNIKVEQTSAEHAATKSVRVGGDFTTFVGQNHHTLVDKDLEYSSKRAMGHALDLFLSTASVNMVQTAGNEMVLASRLGITLDASASILLKVGPSIISMSPGGIEINGPMVRINCGANAVSPDESDMDPIARALDIAFELDGYTTANPAAGQAPGQHTLEQTLDPVSRLENDPSGQVADRAGQTSTSSLANLKAQVLRAASESGQPFVEP